MEGNHRLLSDTIFKYGYGIFQVETDLELINRMSWIAAVFTIVTTVSSLLQPAPYGKFSPSYFGPTVRASFGFMIQDLPGWVVPVLLYIQSPCSQIGSSTNLILASLYTTHQIQRSVFYPLRISKLARRMPISTPLVTFMVNTFNGFFQSHHLLNVEKVEYSAFVIPGVMLFIFGMAVNIYHDGILVSLKSNRSPKDKSEYQIPRGGLFEYVSGANYFGEILEWWGLAIATGKFPQFIFALFSTVFLSIRAWQNHQYYHTLFGKSYPTKRKSLIPFII